MKKHLFVLFSLFVLLPVIGCSGGDENASYPMDNEDRRRATRGKITGDGMQLKLFGEEGQNGGGSGIGVNSFLWRATLDTLSFIPLSSVDPHGGVIITDWYEDPEAPGDRHKINVLILGTELRADGVRVSVFKQNKSGGTWRDTKVSGDVARALENKILTRARELKIKQVKEKR